jgi:hypothetical protein
MNPRTRRALIKLPLPVSNDLIKLGRVKKPALFIFRLRIKPFGLFPFNNRAHTHSTAYTQSGQPQGDISSDHFI